MFSFISLIPFLALNFATCSEVVQNNVPLLATVKSSVQVGGQGNLHLITTDTQTAVQWRKQFVRAGMDNMMPMVFCLMFRLICI